MHTPRIDWAMVDTIEAQLGQWLEKTAQLEETDSTAETEVAHGSRAISYQEQLVNWQQSLETITQQTMELERVLQTEEQAARRWFEVLGNIRELLEQWLSSEEPPGSVAEAKPLVRRPEKS